MSLSGNLSFVPIDEVLRLLTRSKQQGSVDVTGDGIYGRVFIGERGIDLATTSDDEDLHRHLVNSGFAEESALRRITTGETTLAALADSNKAMIALLREMTVESLYQIASRGEDFEVKEGLTTPYASPNSFELEKLLGDSRAREKDWAKVAEVVPDLTGAVSFRRDLGDRDEVTVKTDDWKVLSEIGTGASVTQIADSLGTTEFWAARVASRLVKNDLVDIESGAYVAEQAAEEPAETHDEEILDSEPEMEWDEPTAETVEDEPTVEMDPVEAETEIEMDSEMESESVSTPEADVEVAEASADEADEGEDASTDTDPNESWWQEPEDEFDKSSDDDDEVEPAVVAEGLSEMPAVSADGDSNVEEDTEAFLEKVFSELESTPESDEEPEAQEGHGLLRRRRMGTLRDFSSDS